MPARRISILGAMVLIALLAFAMAFVVIDPQFRYRRTYNRMEKALRALRDRRPSEVPPHVWNNACMVTYNACGEVFSWHDRVSPDEFGQFREDLEQKLQGEVSIETLDWIWERLVRTRAEPPYQGYPQRYVQRIRPSYELALQGLRAGSPRPSTPGPPSQPVVAP